MCWFERGLTDSRAGGFDALPGLGLLKGACCPHYSDEPGRKPAFARLLEQNKTSQGLGIDGGAAVHFVGFQPTRLLSANDQAGAHAVSIVGGELREAALDISRLPLPSG